MNILNKYFNKLYLISSYPTQNRINDVISFFKNENIKFELVIAPKKKYFKPDYNITLANEGNQSLTSANESILLKESYIKSDSFCIIEDDIFFDTEYEIKLSKFFNQLPSDWDILNLGYHEHSPINLKINNDITYYRLNKNEEIVGTHIVSYKRQTVQHLLNIIENSIYPMDWFLTRNIYSDFNTYTCSDKIFYSSSFRKCENKDMFYKKYKSEIDYG
jgi:hypothetical protein